MMGFFDTMSGWGGGWALWTLYLGMIAFWVGLFALLFWGICSASRSGALQTVRRQARSGSAADVLRRRYAAGEIDAAEFEQKRRELF